MSITHGVGNSEWIIGNIKHSGFYRVNYDQENWKLLIAQLENNFSGINEVNRAQLLDDSFNLGRAEIINQTVFLEISKYLKDELDYIPWAAASDGFSYIGNMIAACNDLSLSAYKKFYKNLVQKVYDLNAWNSSLTDSSEM